MTRSSSIVARRRVTPNAFTPTGGAYSHGVSVDVGASSFIFTTGQLAIDPDSKVVGVGDVEAQTRYVIENVATILAEEGAGLEDIVKGQIFLLDIGDAERAVAVFEEYFGSCRPALGILGVSGLAREDCVVEFEAIAVRRRLGSAGHTSDNGDPS
jgi:enamine deaminase RidA (YjgF/YER057c/UK114 family)